MIVILPPYNGSGFPVRQASDVPGVFRQVCQMCFPKAVISVHWTEDIGQWPQARLSIGLDQDNDRAGIIYHGEDEFVPAEPTNNDLAFSDDHAADIIFPVLLSLDEVVNAVAAFYETEGELPTGLQWEEIWRRE